MKFKIDENFKRVARWCYNYRSEDLSIEFCTALEKAGIITEKPENVGKTLYEAKETVQVLGILEVLGRFSRLIKNEFDKVVKNDPQIWDAVNNLILIDWEACPYCGKVELESREPEGHDLNDGDYWTPSGYEIDYYVYECCECGKIIKTREEL